MLEFTIKQIFEDNWNGFVNENNSLTIRPIIFDEVNKIINCGNPYFGYALYICDHCGKFLNFHLNLNYDFAILVEAE